MMPPFSYAPFVWPAHPLRVLGIDPGTTGGLVLLVDGRPEQLLVMPVVFIPGKGKPKKSKKTGKLIPPRGHNEYDESRMVELIRELAPDVAFCEKEWAMNKGGGKWRQGVTSVFTFAQGYGTLRGVLAALKIPTLYVPPQDWQKPLFNGLPAGLTTKDHAYLALHARWPELTFRESRRARTPHEGICDAACIAYYGHHQIPPQAVGVCP